MYHRKSTLTVVLAVAVGASVANASGFADPSSWATYDPGEHGVGSDPDGYFGAVFDGRYIYLAPSKNPAYHTEVLRYDTTESFLEPSSWATHIADARGGYYGAVFDGQYVYFVPGYDGSWHGEVLRYDTIAEFTDSSSWATYDPGAHGVGSDPDGYFGAVFDGRYVYFVPYKSTSNPTVFSGEVLRYDTTGDFDEVLSWATYDVSSNNPPGAQGGYSGGVFDGRYVYFAPREDTGEVLRYDATSEFTSASSWATYDPGEHGVGSDPDGYYGAVFDGRYVYFVPFYNGSSHHGEVLRYDTTGSFDELLSWATYDYSESAECQANPNCNHPEGYSGAVFDGRYVYFAPRNNAWNSWGHGEVLRYDTAAGFDETLSWATYDYSESAECQEDPNCDNPRGYRGAVLDARYIYFVPWRRFPNENHGEVLRYDRGPVFADCAPFYDSLNDACSIKKNGGVPSCPVSFAPGVNGDGVVFDGNCHITYPNCIFDADAGSVSFWLRNDSPGNHGGFLEIGTVGQPTSVGLSHDGNNVCFQMRDDTNGLGLICGPTPIGWNHVVCLWDLRDDERHDMWLFINGVWAGSANLPGPYTQTAGQLEIGHTTHHAHAVGMMDELRFFDWALTNGEAYAEYVYSENRYVNQPTGKPVSTGNVQVIEKALYVDGQPFQVRGVGYQPTPIDSWPSSAIYTEECIMERDMGRLRGIGVNSIRLWSEPPLAALDCNGFLDRCYNDGVDPIYVIMGFYVSADDDYADVATVNVIRARFSDYVTTFKDHPAVLAWGIGNENNLHIAPEVLGNWYALANTLACDAYALEGEDYHPTMVINGDMTYFGDINHLSDDLSMGCVDMWGHNAYPGDDYHCYFDYYDRLSAKPLIITEYGVDAYDAESEGEYQCVQADYDVRQWRQVRDACVGGTIMAYSDEWWKAGYPSSHDTIGRDDRSQPDGVINEEWWGLFAVERDAGGCDTVLPRKVVCALSVEFGGVTGDSDLDDDVDLVDFAAFQRCFGSPVTGSCGEAFDFVADGSINLDDFNMFALCLNGPDQPIACNQ